MRLESSCRHVSLSCRFLLSLVGIKRFILLSHSRRRVQPREQSQDGDGEICRCDSAAFIGSLSKFACTCVRTVQHQLHRLHAGKHSSGRTLFNTSSKNSHESAWRLPVGLSAVRLRSGQGASPTAACQTLKNRPPPPAANRWLALQLPNVWRPGSFGSPGA